MFLYAIVNEKQQIIEYGLSEESVKNRKGVKNRIVRYRKTTPPFVDKRFFTVQEDVPIIQNGELAQSWKVEKLPVEESIQRCTQSLNAQAKQHIQSYLQHQDWGETYEECLSELQNTAISTETKILYFLKPKIPNLTLTQIRENIALYIAGQKTAEDITNELTQAGLTKEEINQYFDLLKSAIEVAKLINWVEEIWDYEEQIEAQIQNTKTIEELEQIMNNIQFPSIE